MKPMLAAKIEFDPSNPAVLNDQLAQLRYPVIGSPKVDGIRVLCHPELGPVTRQFKPVPNTHVRTMLSNKLLAGLDGEVVVGEPNVGDVFNRTTRGVMSRGGEPNFSYLVFDDFTNHDHHYSSRMMDAIDKVRQQQFGFPAIPLETRFINNAEELLEYEGLCLDRGFEGICLRDPDGQYKFNRSTLKQGGLLKLKRIEDAEAIVIDVEPRYQNNNEQVRDHLGYAKRSAHQENKVPLPMVGKLICRSPGFTDTFGVGSGFDHSTAITWWSGKELLIGRSLTFVYQPCGTLDKPRHPIFKGFRED